MTPGTWAADLLEFFLPTGCVVCRTWIPAGDTPAIVCGGCRTRLREPAWPRCPRCHHPSGTGRTEAPDCLECRGWPPELMAARYAYVLEPPADDLVHALKYEGWPELADPMGRSMATALVRNAPDGLDPETRRATVVPIPTTSSREKARGYNQAHLLAERLALDLGLPLRGALVRVSAQRSQTSLSPDERRENVRDAFRVSVGSERALRGAHVVLIDDVLTTGATAAEAAITLVRGGAATVTLVAFARALP